MGKSNVKQVNLSFDEHVVDYEVDDQFFDEEHQTVEHQPESHLSLQTSGSTPLPKEPQSPSLARVVPVNEDTLLQRSVCVKNVAFCASVDQLKDHFKECG